MTPIQRAILVPILALGGATGLVAPGFAADVRAELTAELIWQHCTANGVGSTVEGVWMLPGGKRVTGTVTCTEADMVQPPMAMRHGDDDDDREEREGDDD